MRLLVLGGTAFLSRAVAADAVARGHDVTCAARGRSGTVPEGATLARLDRSDPDWSSLEGEWDAVLDVTSTPSWAAAALTALGERAPYWIYVSSISAYAEHTPHGTPETLPLLEPHPTDAAEDDPASYGARKVACEQLVQRHAAAHWVVRPGLIVGPGDPTGRFSYWPDRLAGGGEVLAPDSPDRDVQLIDVRDLAAWLVTGAEQRLTGVHDATGWVTSLGETLEEIGRGVGADVELHWAHPGFLRRHQVLPWSGPRSLPLWLPEEMSGLLRHDVGAAFRAGLTTRPLAETAADTLAWLRTEAGRGGVTGLTRAEEQDLLDDWHTI
jgi:2'-hydroxyisoflavone reductase